MTDYRYIIQTFRHGEEDRSEIATQWADAKHILLEFLVDEFGDDDPLVWGVKDDLLIEDLFDLTIGQFRIRLSEKA